MNLVMKIKKNPFIVLLTSIYIFLFLTRFDVAVSSVENSSYYIKEMLMIMPVIFVLTALLDLWVSKEKIIKYLGKDSKNKGIMLSFVLGSVSAGPIYAAFPMCLMLHKKGASIRNIIIILSAWAVIKIPMLINEFKFLGFQFMAIRWILTIIAIIIFSWIATKFIKDEDIIQDTNQEPLLKVDKNACMGCTLCAKNYQEIFAMDGSQAYIKSFELEIDTHRLKQTIELCPVNAIRFNHKAS